MPELSISDLDTPAGAILLGPQSIVPTAEQLAIISAARERPESLLVTAYAGCAKSTTLQLICASIPPQPTLAVMFNKKNAKEAEKKLPSWVTVKTLNGVGHSAWSQAIGKRLVLDEKKLGRLVTAICREHGFQVSSEDWASIRSLTSAAMRAGLVPSKYPYKSLLPDTAEGWADLAAEQPDMPSPAIQRLAREVLRESIAESFQGVISFDDQIFCSAMLGGVFPRFPLVLVDEAQDLSELNHIQVRRSAADRLIVVGDSRQAIYQFRGSDAESINKIKALRPAWIELPLATTFRCPQVLVTRQQHHAPGFLAAEGNPRGEFIHIKNDWHWSTIQGVAPGDTAILCRNNAPLLGMAFRLLAQQIGVVMLGRDIGKGLIALAKKISPKGETPVAEVTAQIARWAEHETSLARAKGKDEAIANIIDKADCLHAVISGANVGNASALWFALERLFSRDAGTVTLSTGHRAKGLEWTTVIHLDPFRIPSKFARTSAEGGDPKPMEQENNLRYVIETRAKHTLILANLEDFK